jgi:hypothetical protein
MLPQEPEEKLVDDTSSVERIEHDVESQDEKDSKRAL